MTHECHRRSVCSVPALTRPPCTWLWSAHCHCPQPFPTTRAFAPLQAPRTFEAYFEEDTPTGSAVREVVLYTLNLGAMEEPVAKIELLVQPEAKNRARVRIAPPPKRLRSDTAASSEM